MPAPAREQVQARRNAASSRLAGEYHLDQIDAVPGGVFIDCGANIGELGFWSRIRGLVYIAFEPEPLEAYCCDLNSFGGRAETKRMALWKDTKMISFYSLADHGDSSIFDMSDNAIRTEVQAMKLDDALDYRISGVSGTVIFKVEAEGAEPEVLKGAERILGSVDWVTVDCGFERGRAKTHTFVDTNVFLNDLGFRLYKVDLIERHTALYRNEKRQ